MNYFEKLEIQFFVKIKEKSDVQLIQKLAYNVIIS